MNGKDILTMLAQFTQLEVVAAAGLQTVGEALTKEQQVWVSANYKSLHDFAKSDVGKVAIATFVEDWKASVSKPSA